MSFYVHVTRNLSLRTWICSGFCDIHWRDSVATQQKTKWKQVGQDGPAFPGWNSLIRENHLKSCVFFLGVSWSPADCIQFVACWLEITWHYECKIYIWWMVQRWGLGLTLAQTLTPPTLSGSPAWGRHFIGETSRRQSSQQNIVLFLLFTTAITPKRFLNTFFTFLFLYAVFVQ